MKRIHLIVHGRVQGVFYRDNAQKKASELGLKGFVKNLDSTVEVVVEGSEDKLNELIEFCKNDPGHSNVDKVEIKKEKATGEFEEFEVRY